VSSLYVTTRRTGSGQRYVVRYRLGGRAYPLVHAGSFKTMKEARTRRDFVAVELAAGRNPAETLHALENVYPLRTYRDWAIDYRESRIDLSDGTRRNLASHLALLNDIFGNRDPATLTVPEQIAAVAKLAKSLSASTLTHYWATHRQLLDFAGVRPNPARDPLVKLPKARVEEVNPPSAGHFLAMLGWIPDSSIVRVIVTMERTAMAIGETLALEFGDVDIAGCEFRLRRATVKGGIRSRARRVQVPAWLMDVIADSCPFEDRAATRHVFQGVTASRIRTSMATACTTAGIPVYTPHDLRHRRLSLWHGQGVPVKELAARAGHARASMTLDVYSHVMPLEEVSTEFLEAALVRSR
jgi:integrase